MTRTVSNWDYAWKTAKLARRAGKGHGQLTLLLALGVGIFTSDQLLKASMERQPADSFPRDVQGTHGAARYERCHNDGFMLGFLREHPEMVRLVQAAETAAVIGRFSAVAEKKEDLPEAIGLAMIIGGACSNLYDRFTRGYVVDFLNIRKGALRKIVINIGDAAIAAGACVSAIALLIKEARKYI